MDLLGKNQLTWGIGAGSNPRHRLVGHFPKTTMPHKSLAKKETLKPKNLKIPNIYTRKEVERNPMILTQPISPAIYPIQEATKARINVLNLSFKQRPSNFVLYPSSTRLFYRPYPVSTCFYHLPPSFYATADQLLLSFPWTPRPTGHGSDGQIRRRVRRHRSDVGRSKS